MIIGIDWLRKHNPEIDWDQGKLTLDCCEEKVEKPLLKKRKTRTVKVEKKEVKGSMVGVDPEWEDGPVGGPIEGEMLFTLEQVTIAKSVIPPARFVAGSRYALVKSKEKPEEEEELEWERMGILAGYTHSQQLAEKAHAQDHKKSFEEMVPPQYQQFAKVFSKEASDRMPAHKPYDHAIELKPDAELSRTKAYPMSPVEQEELNRFIQENLAKGYIRPSESEMSSPVFFIKKKDGSLRLVQDYRKLNQITIKNRYPLPLISEIVDKLRGAKFFSKMDVRWGYNNVRIKKGDEHKAAFSTNRGMFEPLVMFFGLTNSPATFQAMMDNIFRDMIDKGHVAVYLDDIIVFTQTLEEHREIVREVLRRLEQNDLFLKPEKCEFEKDSVEYLGLIIKKGELHMDPVKTQAILEWPTPRNKKDVQSFRGFANFYRRFIKDFGKITKPLDRLTGDVEWSWGQEEQEAFDTLKSKFAASPVLAMWEPNRPTRIETDASGFATGGILLQQSEDGPWHPVAYLSQSLNEAERNYEIWDREMLAVVRALENWRHYLEGGPTFEIWTDHKNLESWEKERNLSRRHARWALFFSRFDFNIVYRSGKTHSPDMLSRNPSYFASESDIDDNQNRTILPTKAFKVAASKRGHALVEGEKGLLKEIREKSKPMIEAQKQLVKLGPRQMSKGLEEWNEEEGLLLYRGRVVIPSDPEIQRRVVQLHHDNPALGHPGRWKTLELVSRNYWWSGMSTFVKNYVDACDLCLRTKTFPAKPMGPLQPNQAPEGPWQIITADLITGLPEVDGYNAMAVVVDRFTKQVHISPTTDTVTAEGLADIYLRDVFKLHGIPRQVISDRGPQFAAKYMRHLLKCLHVKSSLSTAYHPRTDGQTERMNQEVEQYLRLYTSRRQDDWVKHLPLAEFAINSREHSATHQSPFFMLYGYHPTFQISLPSVSQTPAVDERLKALKEVQEDTQGALELAAERMKRYFDQHVQEAPQFEVGDKVWIDAKNLAISQPSRKLTYKRLGPYEITKKIGPLNYEVKIPRAWRIHPVFHVELLRPHPKDLIPGRAPANPPPVDVEGQEEYEVEEILDSRLYRRKLEYLVRWKGYDDASNTWEPAENVKNAPLLIKEFHKKHPQAPKQIASNIFQSLPWRSWQNFTIPLKSHADWEQGVWENGHYKRTSRSDVSLRGGNVMKPP